MSLILNIETATKTCSVALAKDGEVLALKEMHGEYSHAENLVQFIQDVAIEAKINLQDIDAIAVSKGPGSYTGLRIGVSTAKGLCFSLNKPLIAVDTLEAMVYQFQSRSFGTNLNPEVSGQISNLKSQIIFCPMIDARRMEVYCGLYDCNGDTVKEVSAEIITADSFGDYLKESKIIFFGDGAAKCKSSITHSNAIFIENFTVSSAGMVKISEQAFMKSIFENVAYFEPFYLKDFVTTTPKKLL